MKENIIATNFFRDKLVALFSEETLKSLNVDYSNQASFLSDETICRLVIRPFTRCLETGNIKHISIDVYKNWFEHFRSNLFELFPIGIVDWLYKTFPIKHVKEGHRITFDVNAWYPKAKLDIDKKYGLDESYLHVSNIIVDDKKDGEEEE